MSVFASDGKTYDDRGGLIKHVHLKLLTIQPGLVTAVTENTVFTSSFDHVLDNNLDPVYTKQI